MLRAYAFRVQQGMSPDPCLRPIEIYEPRHADVRFTRTTTIIRSDVGDTAPVIELSPRFRELRCQRRTSVAYFGVSVSRFVWSGRKTTLYEQSDQTTTTSTLRCDLFLPTIAAVYNGNLSYSSI